MKLYTFKDGDIFGEEDILKKRNRSFSVVCSSNKAIIYKFNKQVFKDVIID